MCQVRLFRGSGFYNQQGLRVTNECTKLENDRWLVSFKMRTNTPTS